VKPKGDTGSNERSACSNAAAVVGTLWSLLIPAQCPLALRFEKLLSGLGMRSPD